MKKILITAIILFFTPVWLALMFVFGENAASYLLNSSSKNILSLKNINLPKIYIVESGSMEPAVKVGGVVVVSPDSLYSHGDIVSYDLNGNGKNIVTHRIFSKQFPNGITGEPLYTMKGDANKDFDPINITNSNIIGKVRLTIPYLGYLASYAKKPWGFILLVIVPATILIYEELKTLFGEAKKGAKKALNKFNRKPRDIKLSNMSHLKEDYVIQDLAIESSINRGILSKIFKSLAYFIPIFGAVLIFISFSASFFADKEKTTGNQFQASSSFPETVILENKRVYW